MSEVVIFVEFDPRSIDERVDLLASEVRSLHFVIFKALCAPFQSKEALRSLPKLQHRHRPHGDEEGVEGKEYRRVVADCEDVDLHGEAHDGGGQQEGQEVLQEGEVHSDLLSEVLLHVVQRQGLPRELTPHHFQVASLLSVVQSEARKNVIKPKVPLYLDVLSFERR